MDEFVNFRFKVREIALDVIRTETDKSKKESAKRLLHICDELRDNILPEIGFEIYDTDKDSNRNSISNTGKSESDMLGVCNCILENVPMILTKINKRKYYTNY